MPSSGNRAPLIPPVLNKTASPLENGRKTGESPNMLFTAGFEHQEVAVMATRRLIKKVSAMRFHMRKALFAIMMALFFSMAWSVIAAANEGEIYRWTDEKGVQHFSNTPPETPVKNLKRQEEIPYDAEADEARMKEDARWRQQEAERAAAEKRRKAEEKAAKEAKEAEEKRQAEAERKAEEEAQEQAEKEAEEKREQHRSTADKNIFVNPSDKIPGISTPPKPTPLPSGRD